MNIKNLLLIALCLLSFFGTIYSQQRGNDLDGHDKDRRVDDRQNDDHDSSEDRRRGKYCGYNRQDASKCYRKCGWQDWCPRRLRCFYRVNCWWK